MRKHKSHEKVKEQATPKLKGVAQDGTGEDGHGKLGHNSGTIRQEIGEIEELMARQRELGKTIREKKAKLKENGVNTMAVNQVLRERRMAQDVRLNFYQDCHIVRDACQMAVSVQDKFNFEEGQRGPNEAEIEEAQADIRGKKKKKGAAEEGAE